MDSGVADGIGANGPTSDLRDPVDESNLERRLSRLDLAAKVRLLTGATSWRLHGEPSVGLREMVVSDGPVGVRGEKWDERLPSVSFPSPTALAASWDVELLHRVGAALAGEARKKDVDVVLGPTVNLHRSPLGGRHFESFSEDPLLTAELGVAYVRGMQAEGVGATPKHYVANDSETDRFTVDVIVDERTLRELYLAPFDAIVHRAQPWLVMAAYNAINGPTATENPLLRDPLETEWGFDGVVVSDWTAVRSTEAAGNAATDLAMPGPNGPWGDALVAAVRAGRVPEAAIDSKVLRLLRLAARVGALDGVAPAGVGAAGVGAAGVGAVAARALAREAEVAGIVLARNAGGLLPLDPSALREVAVIGPNAVDARTQGGGSATVFPAAVVSPVEGLTAALPGVHVVHHRGVRVHEGPGTPPLSTLHVPGTGEPGVAVRLLDGDGRVVDEQTRRALRVYVSRAQIAGEVSAIELAARYTPVATGQHTVGARGMGALRLLVDGEPVAALAGAPGSSGPGAALFEPAELSAGYSLVAGTDIELLLHVDLVAGQTETVLEFLIGEPPVDLDAELAEAGRLAAAADIAVVVVGTTEQIESEGFDRQSLALPGRQDELVRVVAAANPRTVVVVNSGSPVELPWRDDVPAVVLGWFGGQEFGHALADVLLGRHEPGGRLPTTWGAATADVPVLSTTPTDGRLDYSEGLHIGYRAWLRAAAAGGAEPAFVFGSGLGYTSWDYESLSVAVSGSAGSGAALSATVRVRNTGSRPGREVVQIYLSRPHSAVDRPLRWLAGFAPVEAEPGQSVEVPVRIRARALEYWSVVGHAWVLEPGAFTVHAGHDVATLPLSTEIAVG